jgi:hypothetical protein
MLLVMPLGLFPQLFVFSEEVLSPLQFLLARVAIHLSVLQIGAGNVHFMGHSTMYLGSFWSPRWYT